MLKVKKNPNQTKQKTKEKSIFFWQVKYEKLNFRPMTMTEMKKQYMSKS